MRCCDCEFRKECRDEDTVLTCFVKCNIREEKLKQKAEQDHPTEKVCTGKRCPMQVGYDVKNCNNKDCIYRTETEKGGVQE